MDQNSLRKLLRGVRSGKVEVEAAFERLRRLPFESLGGKPRRGGAASRAGTGPDAGIPFAHVDHHRAIRCGFPEVIFCPGKTVEQIAAIFTRLAEGGGNVLATRATAEAYQAVRMDHPRAEYHELPRAITLRQGRAKKPAGHVAIVAAGTSDLPVAEEARVTAEIMDQHVTTHYDVGVAGLHRLLAHSEAIQAARAIVVVAGMEGALASVVGGLVSSPVVAVPTSVGYGASFGGLAALLAMLNSCASNVSVVNIDNGFAGGYIAAMINRQGSGTRDRGPGKRD